MPKPTAKPPFLPLPIFTRPKSRSLTQRPKPPNARNILIIFLTIPHPSPILSQLPKSAASTPAEPRFFMKSALRINLIFFAAALLLTPSASAQKITKAAVQPPSDWHAVQALPLKPVFASSPTTRRPPASSTQSPTTISSAPPHPRRPASKPHAPKTISRRSSSPTAHAPRLAAQHYWAELEPPSAVSSSTSRIAAITAAFRSSAPVKLQQLARLAPAQPEHS